MQTGPVTNEMKEQNVVDNTGNVEDIESAGQSLYLNNGQDCVADINKYLERPIIVDTFTSLKAAISREIPLWFILSQTPSIRSKFENFAYFHGNIDVTIAVSGTQFHTGKLLVSYQPYPLNNEALAVLKQRLTVDAVNYRPLMLNYLSQARGATIIDVKDNQPLKLSVPFISTKPMYRLFNTDATALQPFEWYDDFLNAGSLFLYSINDFGSVSAAPSEVSVMVYANFTDVSLGTLTGTEVILSTESMDERKTGPVEKFFSAAEEIASALVAVPIISNLARPSAMVMSGMSGISSYFGWSKPILSHDRVSMKPDGFCNGAVTIGTDTSKIIGVDPKRELTVDPIFFGSSDDEMSLAYITNVPSYVNTFSWSPLDEAFLLPIFKYAVTPFLNTNYEILSRRYIQPSALSFSASPFSYWRGEIEFTFEFVCSAYHRGKYCVVYEPNISQSTLIGTDLNLNEHYMKIIDLQDAQTVSFCVKWASPRAWLEVPHLPGEDFYSAGNTAFPPSLEPYCNGFIYLVPINTLQSPDDSAIEINTYVRGKNMHYAVPNQEGIPDDRTVLITESLSMTEVTCQDLNPSTADTKNIHMQHFGEKILSFRSLLKRYQYNDSVITVGSSVPFLIATIPILPRNNLEFGSLQVDATRKDLWSYLRYAYLGMRGSMRHRIKFARGGVQTPLSHVNVTLNPPVVSFSDQMTMSSSSNYVGNTLSGGVTYMTYVNSAVEVDMPFYSSNLWVFSQPSDLVGTQQLNEMSVKWSKDYNVLIDQHETIGVTDSTDVYLETATGEDFSFYHFTGAPPYTLNITP